MAPTITIEPNTKRKFRFTYAAPTWAQNAASLEDTGEGGNDLVVWGEPAGARRICHGSACSLLSLSAN
jgi:hypothetical protein